MSMLFIQSDRNPYLLTCLQELVVVVALTLFTSGDKAQCISARGVRPLCCDNIESHFQTNPVDVNANASWVVDIF